MTFRDFVVLCLAFWLLLGFGGCARSCTSCCLFLLSFLLLRLSVRKCIYLSVSVFLYLGVSVSCSPTPYITTSFPRSASLFILPYTRNVMYL